MTKTPNWTKINYLIIIYWNYLNWNTINTLNRHIYLYIYIKLKQITKIPQTYYNWHKNVKTKIHLKTPELHKQKQKS